MISPDEISDFQSRKARTRRRSLPRAIWHPGRIECNLKYSSGISRGRHEVHALMLSRRNHSRPDSSEPNRRFAYEDRSRPPDPAAGISTSSLPERSSVCKRNFSEIPD